MSTRPHKSVGSVQQPRARLRHVLLTSARAKGSTPIGMDCDLDTTTTSDLRVSYHPLQNPPRGFETHKFVFWKDAILDQMQQALSIFFQKVNDAHNETLMEVPLDVVRSYNGMMNMYKVVHAADKSMNKCDAISTAKVFNERLQAMYERAYDAFGPHSSEFNGWIGVDPNESMASTCKSKM